MSATFFFFQLPISLSHLCAAIYNMNVRNMQKLPKKPTCADAWCSRRSPCRCRWKLWKWIIIGIVWVSTSTCFYQNFHFCVCVYAVRAGVHWGGVGERVEWAAEVGLQWASHSPQQKRQHHRRVRCTALILYTCTHAHYTLGKEPASIHNIKSQDTHITFIQPESSSVCSVIIV